MSITKLRTQFAAWSNGSMLWSPFGLYYGWVIVAAALLMNLASSSMNPVTFSFFLAPMGQELGWSRSDISWAITFRLVVAGITGPVLGQLIDRHGTRWLGALAGIIGGATLCALSLVDQLWMLYLIYAVSGLAGFGGPAGGLLTIVPVGKWFILRRSTAMAAATVGFPLGTVLAIQIAQFLISTAGWRAAWLVFGAIMAAAVTPLSAFFMRRIPEDHGLLPDGAVAPTARAGEPRPLPVVEEVAWTRGEALRTRAAWLILTAMLLMGFALSGTLVHRVEFWQRLGMEPGTVALGTAVDPFTVIFSAMLFGMIGQKVPVHVLGLIAGGGMGLSMLPMVFTSGEVFTIFLHGIAWGGFAGAFITTNNLIWPTYFGRRSLGAIQGIVLPAAVISNGLAAPAYGYLLDLGVEPAVVWTLSLALFSIAGFLLFYARPPQKPAGEGVLSAGAG